MDEGKNIIDENRDTSDSELTSTQEPSMTSLILWNISNAEKKNPSIDLRAAINNVQEQLDCDPRNFNKIISLHPVERHLACALLAWQELGHTTADSLYEFVEARIKRESIEQSCNTLDIITREPKCIKDQKCMTLNNPECVYSSGKTATFCYNKTPSKQGVSSIEDSTSYHSKNEESLIYKDNSYKNLNLNADKITSSNAKNPECRYDCNVTPINQDVIDIEDSTFSKYETEENSNVRDKHLKHSIDKILHNNVKRSVCRFDNNMTSRNLEAADIKNSSYFQYKTVKNTKHAFITDKDFKNNSDDKITHNNVKKPNFLMTLKDQVASEKNDTKPAKFVTSSLNTPVVKLPVDTKIIMRSENAQNSCRHVGKSRQENNNDIGSKIDDACCMDFACKEQLIKFDKTISELRTRAGQLARREAERIELIERAEAAWKDLELGYQRRLSLAQEKEDDISKQVQKLTKERNSYKEACMNLTTSLKQKGETADKDRDKLTGIEKEICDCANVRLRLSQEFARGDAALTEQYIKAAKLDRDLQFKEDQAQRKLSLIESEVEVARALTLETERAMRTELCTLKEQIEQLSEQLLGEESESCKIKSEIQDLQHEKSSIIEDVEGCQMTCDNNLQDKLKDLKKKREQLNQLKTKVNECKGKLPVDVAVEVKRTPSLVTLSKCLSENKILDQCSCTSLRGQLLTNLFADLFSGLQTELDTSGSMMPCQLLKCLEEKHNWDRSSTIKNNLRGFFSHLLLRELDIAIATSIEKYHAMWVGATRVEATKSMDVCENHDKQECATEYQADKLANKLAEQLFSERADQLIQRVKDIINASTSPCDCKHHAATIYPCLVKQPMISGRSPGSINAQTTNHKHRRKTSRDVTQLMAQRDDLKKESIKKEDLMLLEDKITKLFQVSLVPEPTATTMMQNTKNQRNAIHKTDGIRRENKYHRNLNTDLTKQTLSQKQGSINKKQDVSSKKKNKNQINVNNIVDKSSTLYKKLGKTYAVNVCLCEVQKESTKLNHQQKTLSTALQDHESNTSGNKKNVKVPQMCSSVKETKSISFQRPSMSGTNVRENKIPTNTFCKSSCTCFHKIPSNSSIDKLFNFLTKWKDDSKNIIIKNSLKNMVTNSKTNSILNSINSNAQNSSKDTASEKALPTTESEYMGAVNLNKSNDFSCNTSKEMIKNSDSKNDTQNFNLHFESSDDKCKRSLENNTEKLHGSSFSKHHSISIKNNLSTDHLLFQKNSSEKTVPNSVTKINKSSLLQNRLENKIVTSNQKERYSKQNVLQSGIHNITNNAEIFPNDCDCSIKFLGVTLSNTKSNKVLDKNKQDYIPKFIYCNQDLDAYTLKHIKEPIKKPNTNYEQNAICDAPILLKTDITTCQCEAKLDELKKNIGATFQRRDEFYEMKDKALDIQNLKYSLVDIKENCVCCNNELALDESKDLEVNTFNLLEDHFKKRLEKFKSCCCKSFCISSDEEENIFSSLLQKVKQVISETVNKTTCACSREEQTDNSWNRIQSLLLEYLKAKIKHVQCISNEEKNLESILPNALDKVYNLVENDFQRLKLICKCHCIDSPNDVILNERKEYYIPEKDTNTTDGNYKYISKIFFSNCETIQDETSNIESLCKLGSNKSIFLNQNISMQVPYNLVMETKACNTTEKGNKNIQITESINTISSKYCSDFKPGCDCDHNFNVMTDTILDHCTNEFQFIDVPKYLPDSEKVCYPVLCGDKCNNVPELQQNGIINSEARISTSQEISSSNQYEADLVCSDLKSPYIGYTIDCSCQCTDTCIKSTIMKNNEQINNILNNTKEKLQSQNISYIMNSVPKTNTTKHITNNKLVISDIDNDIPEKNVRDSKVSVHNEEEIFLKDSSVNLNVSYNTTNTSYQMINLDNDSVVPVIKNTISKCKPNNFKQISKQDPYIQHHSILKGNSVKSEPFLNSTTKIFEKDTSGCDCSLVPVCHVKMLVESIENKLMHTKCTCDSLNPKVCPLHSSKHLV